MEIAPTGIAALKEVMIWRSFTTIRILATRYTPAGDLGILDWEISKFFQIAAPASLSTVCLERKFQNLFN
jgi:hypothetical protein